MTGESEFVAPPRLAYGGSRLARATEARTDAEALRVARQDPRAGFYVVTGGAIVLKTGGATPDPLFIATEARALGDERAAVFLGRYHDAPRFGLLLDASAAETLQTREGLKVVDLRMLAVQGEVDAAHLAPLATAKAVLDWHARHRFCPNCGSATLSVLGGWRRDCPVCKAEHFPRTDPVVIMLPIAGERCVLGRSPRFPRSMWSCLAGFCEPGESIEEAVRREVAEEVGVRCGAVRYFASQPWPFPSSLMIGCVTEAADDTVVIDPGEIEAARWFDRAELKLMLKRQHPDGLTTPPPMAIAHHIIGAFVERGADILLR